MGLSLNTVHQGDCIEKLAQVDAGSIDLVFADPPFNIGYEYDVYDDRRSDDDYLDWSRKWIEGVMRVLKPSGTFWLAIGDEYAAELKVIAQQVGFKCRSWVIWYYTFGVNLRRGFSRSHTHLFHFIKDPKDFTFNTENPAIRVPSARQLVYADARANPKGRLPDNTWFYRPQDIPNGFPADHDTWYFPRVAGTFKEREGFHGCQMPEQLLARIIRACSHPMDTVLDPFTGSGTTVAVAHKLGRHWVGIELSEEYVKYVEERLGRTRVGDPLDGAEDPLKSAPSTKSGKMRGVVRGGLGKQKSLTPKALRIREEIDSGVLAAYKATHNGYSTDYLLADPDTNAAFCEWCSENRVPGEPVIWNQSLLRLRKASKFPKLTKQRFQLTLQEMDGYSFASEVALLQITVTCDLTVDELLCDPELAARFDEFAALFAPGHTPLEYRWAALSLRKLAQRSKQAAKDSIAWLERELPEPVDFGKRAAADMDGPGVYLLTGRDDVSLYIGATFNLNERLQQIAGNAAWKDLKPSTVRLFPETEPRLLGLKSVLIHRLNPVLNSPLLVPTLDD